MHENKLHHLVVPGLYIMGINLPGAPRAVLVDNPP